MTLPLRVRGPLGTLWYETRIGRGLSFEVENGDLILYDSGIVAAAFSRGNWEVVDYRERPGVDNDRARAQDARTATTGDPHE